MAYLQSREQGGQHGCPRSVLRSRASNEKAEDGRSKHISPQEQLRKTFKYHEA